MIYNTSNKAAGTVMGLALAFATPFVAAEPFQATFSGWSVAATMDVNADAISGFSTTVSGVGRFGRFQAHTVSETGPVTGICGPTAVTLEFTVWSNIQRFADGDLLYYSLDESQASKVCFDYVSGALSNEIHALISGGTGRFKNATGRVVLNATGDQTLADTAGNGVHSSVSGTVEGEILLSNGTSYRSEG
jgi:hypothetical protein